MTIDTRPPDKTPAEILAHANAMRAERHRKIRYAMERRSQAQDAVSDHTLRMATAEAQLSTAEKELATLLEAGEKKVIGNSLLTLDPSGGIRIEPVDVVALL